MGLDSQSPVLFIKSKTGSFLDAQKCLNRIIGPHDLININEKEPLVFSFEGSFTGKMTVGELVYGKDVIFKTKPCDDMNHYCITRPKVGMPIFHKNGLKFLSTYDNATIVSPHDKFEINIKRDCIQSFLSFNKDFVKSVLSDIIDEPVNVPLIFENTMFTNDPKISAWWDLTENINNMLLKFENFSYFNEMKKEFEYIIVKSLILTQINNYSDIINNKYKNLPEYINRALSYIKDNIKSNIEINSLEKVSGVSKQKLSTCFKKHMGLSINSYIRLYRLKCINNDILNSRKNINITYIALKWGVKHLGRFSREYKEVFGESPSITLKKIIVSGG